MAFRHWTGDGAGPRRIRVGLLADEGMPSRMAKILARELPQVLQDRLSGEVAAYLDAPVSGSTGPARNGTLVWLTSGSREAFELAEPTLRDLGSAVEYLGSGVEGSAVKIAVNAWMTSATVAMSDVLSLCDALGIDHELFARVLADGPLAMPYAQQKATAMDGHAYTAGFAVELARKDLALAEESLPPRRCCWPYAGDWTRPSPTGTATTTSRPSTTSEASPNSHLEDLHARRIP